MKVKFTDVSKGVGLPENDVDLDAAGIAALQSSKFLILKKRIDNNSYAAYSVEVEDTALILFKNEPHLAVFVREADEKNVRPYAWVE